MSRFTLANPASRAAPTARSISPARCTRPRRTRSASTKLCAPSEMRLKPAARIAANLGVSTVPGFASLVISAPSIGGCVSSTALSSLTICPSERNVGVPPPKNTVLAGRPAHGLERISRSIASTVRPMIAPPIVYELKSQYPHLVGQNGVCTYTATGDVMALPRADQDDKQPRQSPRNHRHRRLPAADSRGADRPHQQVVSKPRPRAANHGHGRSEDHGQSVPEGFSGI